MECEQGEVQEASEAGSAARKRKRVGSENAAEGVYGKELLGEDNGEDAGYEGIVAEEAVAEVMRWMEAEIADNGAVPLAPSPPRSGFVTINGYEESCGPSLSAAASTVMAYVDTRAGVPLPPPVPWPWPEPEPFLAAPAVGVDVEMEMEWLHPIIRRSVDDAHTHMLYPIIRNYR